ncbi:ABC transporter permease [Sphingobacterium bambusae]|uniref:ABC transporter permease n=1 Tax=Sphingobacterium bambusae TaxID=662858 RepID=A0ABW6BCC6_9SPHI|nr:FtsX-like permease family protein [Sphingobacterium bambusae]WPL48331.1 FtsX-like permease family protein [Sphingobacterium bambusae]
MSWKWIFLMAWRDSRRSRARLFLYIASIVLGISAFVAMDSFKTNLNRDIDAQAAGLLGADLELSSRTSPQDGALAFIDSIAKKSEGHAREERFVSMLRFVKNGESRLIQVRGLSAGYPYYGAVEGEPTHMMDSLSDPSKVLLENELMLQFNASIGDSVQIGDQVFTIAGKVLKMAGRTGFASSMAPSALLSLDAMAATGLKQVGSRVDYFYYFKLPRSFAIDGFAQRNEELLEKYQLGSATIASTKENTGRSFADVTRFMQLVGFAALLLGAIGVSSAVHVYVQEKMVTVATLRCLGATAKKTFAIFFVQFAVIGVLSGIVGSVLGSLLQYLLPLVMQEFVPVDLSSAVSWTAILQGIVLGFGIAVLFALLPLSSIRKISPLNTLRVISDTAGSPADPLRLAIIGLILLCLTLFSRLQLEDLKQTAFFVLGIAFTFAVLYGTAQGLMFMVRRFFPQRWPYVWRQGLANLFRPRNQTIVVVLAIGFGTALIATLSFVQDMLLKRVDVSNDGGQANVVLFDIQPGQREGLKTLIEEQRLPVMEEVPIVTLQLSEINGHNLQDVLADSTLGYSARAFRGEIRATYRDSLADSETLVAGKWIGQVQAMDTAQVSLEEGYAERIGAKVGDRLLLNVQGLPMPARVASLRRVDWNRFQTNFRMVLAKGSLEKAPQFFVMMTKAENEGQSAALQRNVVQSFPNVSVIDLHSLIATLTEILDKIGFVIRFIGSFSILTGVMVLFSSLMISKYQRLKENVLLRTLGASKRQIGQILFSEYLFLGLFSALTGLLIAVVATNALALFVFEATFVPSIVILLGLLVAVVLVSVVIGVFNSLSSLNRPTLEILRKD